MDDVQQADGEVGHAGVRLIVGDGIEAGTELEEKCKTWNVPTGHSVLLKNND